MDKKKLRELTLGSKPVFQKEIVEHNGGKFEVRQPTIRKRSEMRLQCQDENGGFNMLKFLLWGVIENTYVPDTDELVFDAADYDSLAAEPTGSYVDILSEAAGRLLNVDGAEVKKSSEQTQKGNSALG